MKPSEHKHISKNQEAAELCVQLITSIYELFNAKGDITPVYLRRRSDVFLVEWLCETPKLQITQQKGLIKGQITLYRWCI